MKSLKELSIRIKNIKSVQKTTKMMQMVSAAKLMQSQKKLSNSRCHISKLHDIISSLISLYDEESLAKTLNLRHTGNVLVFIIASDRGLCGNFNSSIIKSSYEHIRYLMSLDKKVDIVLLGKKAFDIGKRVFNSQDIIKFECSKGITLNKIDNIVNCIDLSKYDLIKIFFSKFYNAFTQKPTIEVVRPWSKVSSLTETSMVNIIESNYDYEPENREFILRSLINDYTVASIYSAVLESAASENSTRMVTMESANRNTKEMLNKLALLYNRSRQAAITTDLIEVIGGAEAL